MREAYDILRPCIYPMISTKSYHACSHNCYMAGQIHVKPEVSAYAMVLSPVYLSSDVASRCRAGCRRERDKLAIKASEVPVRGSDTLVDCAGKEVLKRLQATVFSFLNLRWFPEWNRGRQ